MKEIKIFLKKKKVAYDFERYKVFSENEKENWLIIEKNTIEKIMYIKLKNLSCFLLLLLLII